MICTVVIACCECEDFAMEQGLILTSRDKHYEECPEKNECYRNNPHPVKWG